VQISYLKQQTLAEKNMRARERLSNESRTWMILFEKVFKSKLSGNEVYYTACSLLVTLKDSCIIFHCQNVFI